MVLVFRLVYRLLRGVRCLLTDMSEFEMEVDCIASVVRSFSASTVSVVIGSCHAAVYRLGAVSYLAKLSSLRLYMVKMLSCTVERELEFIQVLNELTLSCADFDAADVDEVFRWRCLVIYLFNIRCRCVSLARRVGFSVGLHRVLFERLCIVVSLSFRNICVVTSRMSKRLFKVLSRARTSNAAVRMFYECKRDCRDHVFDSRFLRLIEEYCRGTNCLGLFSRRLREQRVQIKNVRL